MDTHTLVTILQILTAALIFWSLVERVRERKRQRDAERQAGEFLVSQVADAPEGSIIILGAAKYRTRNPLRITRDCVTLQGAPEHTSKILVEGDNNAIEVENAKGVCIRDMHIEILGPPPVIPTVKDEPPLEDVKVILNPDNEDIADIMRRDYEMAGTSI